MVYFNTLKKLKVMYCYYFDITAFPIIGLIAYSLLLIVLLVMLWVALSQGLKILPTVVLSDKILSICITVLCVICSILVLIAEWYIIEELCKRF